MHDGIPNESTMNEESICSRLGNSSNVNVMDMEMELHAC
jgi:hypothetical protein